MPKEKLIIGAIAGDIIGSVYKWNNKNFNYFCKNRGKQCLNNAHATMRPR